MINEIKSRTNNKIKYLVDLKDTSFSRKEKKFLIEGDHLAELAEGYIDEIYSLSGNEKYRCNAQYKVTFDILDKISQNKNGGKKLVAVCNEIPSKSMTLKRILFIDNVQDPGNVGTILRTALSFGFTDIYMSKMCAYRYSFKVIQASQGAIFKLNIHDGDLEEIKELKKQNYKIISTALTEKSTKLSDFEFKDDEKYLIVVGNEGSGVRKEILDLSDITLKIEMNNIDSLNVGVATGIVLYKARI